jgi:hypothetical protein
VIEPVTNPRWSARDQEKNCQYVTLSSVAKRSPSINLDKRNKERINKDFQLFALALTLASSPPSNHTLYPQNSYTQRIITTYTNNAFFHRIQGIQGRLCRQEHHHQVG